MADTKVIDGLNGLLADSTVFYRKLRRCHCHVEGRHFFELQREVRGADAGRGTSLTSAFTGAAGGPDGPAAGAGGPVGRAGNLLLR